MQGGYQSWDITDWLGDGSTVSVSKSVHRPMGSFVMQIPDYPFHVSPQQGGDADTLYGLLEPLDEVEIRLARSHATIKDAPILMRGFIRDIRRVEVMSPEGKPNRLVVIQGNDYGLIFNITQIPPPKLWMTLQGYSNLVAGLMAYQLLHLTPSPHPVGEFMRAILNHLITPQLQSMSANFSSIPLLEESGAIAGQIVPFGVDTMVGPIWNTMARVADTPWNELFVDDVEQGPVLRFRVCPWHDVNSAPIPQANGQVGWAETVNMDIESVIHLDAARNDMDVANLFWVNGGGFEQLVGLYNQIFNTAQHAGSLVGVSLSGNEAPNSDPDLYGYRYMEVDTHLLPDLINELQSVPEATQRGNERAYENWAEQRRKGLAALNKDNVIFEHGKMILKGNEDIRAGKWVQLQRGQLYAEYYAATVTHDFAPYRHYTTTVEFVRGTGFIQRMKQTNPHLKEGRRGIYGGGTD